jgi:hypothetical protein
VKTVFIRILIIVNAVGWSALLLAALLPSQLLSAMVCALDLVIVISCGFMPWRRARAGKLKNRAFPLSTGRAGGIEREECGAGEGHSPAQQRSAGMAQSAPCALRLAQLPPPPGFSPAPRQGSVRVG